ncbi:endo alpha-1,4 polygalactosaminidase [Nitratifractor sp.]
MQRWDLGVGAVLLAFALGGCGGGGESSVPGAEAPHYREHKAITSTVFWIGETGSADNGGISNIASVWDDLWERSYGGVDDPENREGYRPAGFVPYENPFYVALPFNDFDKEGHRKRGLESIIPWYTSPAPGQSLCKNRWIRIRKGDRVAYAQWEDAGPFGEDDAEYVFGDARPKNARNDHAGIDLSPAVRDYLGAGDVDRVDWRFVDASEVPDGPWKETVTRSGLDWIDPDLYLAKGTDWNWQLTGDVNLSIRADVYDLDLFDTPVETIEALHDRGIRVICYFSAGSWEPWREDAGAFPDAVKGKKMQDWDERWLDIRSPAVRVIMQRRLDLAKAKGCDGVEPDNVDGYSNDTGFELSGRDQILYNRFLALQAHHRGLSIALKNDLAQAAELEPWFDFALNEQCHEFDECDLLDPFIRAGKAVFNAEYARKYVENTDGARDALCDDARRRGFSTLVLPRELDGSFRYDCGE